MPRFAILADDLTGASDTGVQFSRLGGRVLVLVSLERLPARLAGEWEVVVLNSGSRNVAPAEARQRVQRALAFLEGEGYPLRYKKVDSTLRGHLVPELEAVLERGAERAFIAPAFPLNGRTVEDGVLKVRGVPVHETEMARDGLAPVRTGAIADMLGRGWGPVARLPLAVVRQGDAAVQRWLAGPEAAGRRIVVCDAAEQADLATVAGAIGEGWARAVAVGSAGMARELARLWLPERAPGAAAPPPGAGPVLVVAGSRSAVTREQVAHLMRQPGVAPYLLDPGWVDDGWNPRRRDTLVEQAVAALGDAPDGTVGVVTVSPGSGGDAAPDTFRERSRRLNELLGAIIAAMAGRPGLRGLVLTGGDIAFAALEALDAYGVRLADEVLPGIPRGALVGGRHEGLPVVTKAGGFGPPEALTVAAQGMARGAGDADGKREAGG